MDWKLVATIVNFLAKNPYSPVWATEGILIQVKGYLSDAFHFYSCNCPTEKSLYSAELAMNHYQAVISGWKRDMQRLENAHAAARACPHTKPFALSCLWECYAQIEAEIAKKWGENKLCVCGDPDCTAYALHLSQELGE